MVVKAFVIGGVLGVLLSIFMIIMVFATGQTFGQRCSSMGYHGPDFSICVSNLAEGKPWPPQ